MSENTTSKNEVPADPPAPNGHASNGVTAHDARDAQPSSATPSVKKRKKKKPAVKAGAASTPQNTQAAAQAEPSLEADGGEDPASALPADPPTDPPADAPTAAASAEFAEPSAPQEPPQEPLSTDPSPADTAPSADAAPAETISGPAVDMLRLRMKVWTDPATGKRFLMPSAFMRDVVNGQPVSDVMYAYAMSDEETKLVLLRAHEWNTLPFYYFHEDGEAPRASSRPIDVVVSGGRPS